MAANKKKELKVHYDADIDALSVVVRSCPEEEFEEIAPGVSVEFDKRIKVIGFEILDASRCLRDALPKMTEFLHSGRKMSAVS